MAFSLPRLPYPKTLKAVRWNQLSNSKLTARCLQGIWNFQVPAFAILRVISGPTSLQPFSSHHVMITEQEEQKRAFQWSRSTCYSFPTLTCWRWTGCAQGSHNHTDCLSSRAPQVCLYTHIFHPRLFWHFFLVQRFSNWGLWTLAISENLSGSMSKLFSQPTKFLLTFSSSSLTRVLRSLSRGHPTWDTAKDGMWKQWKIPGIPVGH